jgi:2-keto-4-pentenoate hydratase/2-oxohepta-3-ene-1,7-dioic acid hydratase in catechol pathway
MKLYLGLLESSLPNETRIFGEVERKLLDLKLAYAAYLAHAPGNHASAYDLGAFYFPQTIADFLERGEPALKALDEVVSFARTIGIAELRGPAGEKIAYHIKEVRLLPPFQNPEKSFVIGFSDKARVEVLPKAEIPTGFYKLPQTFVTSGAPIVWPKFSEELDADACLALVIGKAGRRIPPDQAWDYIGGATILLDITGRDVNRREGLTTNNLLGKNFPSSTSIGPAVLLKPTRKELESVIVKLSLDGSVKQEFTLRNCVFTIEQIVARWSILGIKPGDFLAIGASMALQGDRLQNPAPLKIGSNVSCSSPAISELSHQVVSSKGVRR